MRGMRCCFALSLAACAASAALHAATLEEMEKTLDERQKSFTSLTYSQSYVTEMKNSNFTVTSTTITAHEIMKKGETLWVRTDAETIIKQTMLGKDTETKVKELTIKGNEFSYRLSESNGVKEAKKSKVDIEKAAAGKFFDTYRSKSTLKALPDETIEGQDCFVLEAKDKNDVGTTMTLWFAKSCGIMMKVASKNSQGSTFTMETKNLKINPSIAEDRFVFRAPEGVPVQVIEMPQTGKGAGGE